jgi:hypothetical protein
LLSRAERKGEIGIEGDAFFADDRGNKKEIR